MQVQRAAVHEQTRPSVGRTLLSTGGTILGDALGGPVGGALGGAAGGILSDIFGFGSYRAKKNTVQDVDDVRFTPSGIRIRHTEFVADLSPNSTTSSSWSWMLGISNPYTAGNTGNSTTQLPINPAYPGLFPWLATIATSFAEYEFKGLVFKYRPTSGSYSGASGTASLGSIQMATQYNTNAYPFESKSELDSYEYSTSAVPYTPMFHPVECDPSSRTRQRMLVWQSNYGMSVPNPTIGANQAPTVSRADYELGLLTIASSGVPGSQPSGELWVTYDIEFYLPRITTLNAAEEAIYRNTVSLECDVSDKLYKTGAFALVKNTLRGLPDVGNVIYANTTNSLVFNRLGFWHVQLKWITTGTTVPPSIASLGSNLSLVTDQFIANTNNVHIASDTNNASLTFTLKVSGKSLYADVSANTLILGQFNSMANGNVEMRVYRVQSHTSY